MNLKTLLNSDNYQNSIGTLLSKCSHRTQVEFALHCAKDLDRYCDVNEYPEVKKTRAICLGLVTNWLIDSNSVTKEELKSAASEAYAAYDAAYAAYDAAYDAAYAAAYAADYAANVAANVAYSAAHAPAYAAFDSDKQEHLKSLLYYLVKLYLKQTDESFKEETFNLLYLNKGEL